MNSHKKKNLSLHKKNPEMWLGDKFLPTHSRRFPKRVLKSPAARPGEPSKEADARLTECVLWSSGFLRKHQRQYSCYRDTRTLWSLLWIFVIGHGGPNSDLVEENVTPEDNGASPHCIVPGYDEPQSQHTKSARIYYLFIGSLRSSISSEDRYFFCPFHFCVFISEFLTHYLTTSLLMWSDPWLKYV